MKNKLLAKKHNKVYIKKKGNAQSQLGHLHIWVENRQKWVPSHFGGFILLFIFLF